jgi:AcrR family transcriptional regulator
VKTARGLRTQTKVTTAAARLFRDHGYMSTTMAAIAAEAGVAVQTLYLAFGSKVAILEAVHDLAIAGDDEPVPVLERPWVQNVRSATDARAAWRVAVANVLDIVERVSSVRATVQAAAADPEVAALLAEINKRRFDTLAAVSELIAAKRGYPRRLPPAEAADVFYAVTSPDLHRLFTVERGWSREQWREWVSATLVGQLATS